MAPIMTAGGLIRRPGAAIAVDRHIMSKKSKSHTASSSRPLYKAVRSLVSRLGIELISRFYFT